MLVSPSSQAQSVVELRQYKIMPGKLDGFIDLFEHHFIESQEDKGMRLVGQFRDRSDPNRFVWIRTFPSMDLRARALNDFYSGPIWAEHRNTANSMLEDNDNVLLLKPAWLGADFTPAQTERPAPGATPAPAATIVVTIEYLWKDPEEGYATHFHDHVAAYAAAGVPVLGAFVPENRANNFPRLPVRQNERLFVWVTRVAKPKDCQTAMRRIASFKDGRTSLGEERSDYLERQPQILYLSPTRSSLLR